MLFLPESEDCFRELVVGGTKEGRKEGCLILCFGGEDCLSVK